MRTMPLAMEAEEAVMSYTEDGIPGKRQGLRSLGLSFLITWFTDPPTRIFRILEEKKNYFF